MTLSLIYLQREKVLVKLRVTSKGLGRHHKVNLHPTRENRRTRQPSANRSISNHEHLRLLGVFGEVSFLNPDSDEDDAAEEDRKTDDDAVAIGLGEELDSHLLRLAIFAY